MKSRALSAAYEINIWSKFVKKYSSIIDSQRVIAFSP